MAAKKWVFCKEYVEVPVLCNGIDRQEILAKTSVGVLYRTLSRYHNNYNQMF